MWNCKSRVTEDLTGKIGGEGTVVEIDESKLGKKKYQRGQFVDGFWIYGMVERGGGELRHVKRRSVIQLLCCP